MINIVLILMEVCLGAKIYMNCIAAYEMWQCKPADFKKGTSCTFFLLDWPLLVLLLIVVSQADGGVWWNDSLVVGILFGFGVSLSYALIYCAFIYRGKRKE